MKLIFALSLAFMLGLSPRPGTAMEFSSVEERMSAKDLQATGLEKLSPQELAALNAWLRKQFSRVAQTREREVAATYEAKAEVERIAKTFVSSAILGDFSGWSGRTMFRLENGQVWKQTNSDVWHVKTSDPVAVIEKSGFMDTWMLHVDGYDRKTHVTRVQ